MNPLLVSLRMPNKLLMIQLCFGGFCGAMILLDSIKLLQIVDLVLHINSEVLSHRSVVISRNYC